MSGGGDWWIMLWNSSSGKLVKCFDDISNQEVLDLNIKEDGSKFACGGSDKTLYYYDVISGKCDWKFFGHDNKINAVSSN